MKKLNLLLMAILASVLVAGPAFADENATGGKSPEMATSSTYTQNKLVGFNVIDQQGNAIGRINNVNMNSDTGLISFVNITTGGFLGIGAKDHAVPIAVLRINTNNRTVTLLVSKDKLVNAPTQAKDMSDKEFRGLIDTYYGIAPAWEEHGGQPRTMMQ
jgi:sporulation protein YlmC with PRC-barrel domain